MTTPAGIARCDLPIPGSARVLTVFTVTGQQPGPVLATIGAIHGDEMEGPLTLSRLMGEIDPVRLRGTWIVCPLANPEAVAHFSRAALVDGKNLARCFPGRLDGSYTEALAALITAHVIAPTDFLMDLHSGGTGLDSVTFAGYGDAPNGVGARSRSMAEAFGAPVVWRHEPPMAPGRTLSVADDRGIPAIYVEAGGGPFPPTEVLELYRLGVLRVMRHLGMHDAEMPPARPPLQVVGPGDLDVAGPSPETGLCACHVELLQPLEPDTLCFTITDLDGTLRAKVPAGTSAYPMFLRRNRWVEKGDLLMALAIRDAALSGPSAG